MQFPEGTRLGPYEVLGVLGAGGMGEVLRARDSRLERSVALKVLPLGAVADAGAKSRLIREARLAASLNHPCICTVHDVGEAGGLVYVAMEHVSGRPLVELIPKDGLPSDQVLRYGAQIADALAHAHGNGVVHRDLKSANVLVTADGRIKVLDFGLAARLTQNDVEDATRSVASLDGPGVVAGTLPYMAPEALRGEPADPRGDVWSFGVMLYEMASGRRPFHGKSGVDLTTAILRDPVPPVPPRTTQGLVEVIGRCLEKDAQRRYRDGATLHAAIVAVQAGSSSTSPPRLMPRHRHIVNTLVAVAIALTVALLVRGLWRNGSSIPGNQETIHSLAVLPLENLSGDPSQDYFADGLTEELIAKLSKVTGLSVTARTSVMQFKKTERPVAEIARRLGVQAVVEGTVARSGDRLRITARLLDAESGKSLWSERYDRASSDVLTLQGEVASAVGDAIRINITPQQRKRLSSAPANNSEAYDLYLRGRYHAGRENPDDIRQAIEFFERAAAGDPQSAAAHAELARAYGQRLFYVAPGDTAVQERAFVEIERALAIDPELEIAHLARGLILWQPWNRFPHERAIAAYRRAIELNPNSDEAHHQLGLVYLHVGLLEQGRREVLEAIRLNPSNTLAQFREGVEHLYSAQYVRALDIFSRTPPAFQPALVAFQEADALLHLDRRAEAEKTADDYLRSHPEDLGGLNTAIKALVAAGSGDANGMLRLVRTAQEKGKGYGHFHHTAFTIARAFALAGRAEDAVKWLQQAADDGFPCYPVFANDKMLDRVRGDRGFSDFLSAQRAQWERYRKLAE